MQTVHCSVEAHACGHHTELDYPLKTRRHGKLRPLTRTKDPPQQEVNMSDDVPKEISMAEAGTSISSRQAEQP